MTRETFTESRRSTAMDVIDVLPRDAIASIDSPTFGTEYIGSKTDEVLVIEGATARAYPIRILNYHEVVNDVVDDQPVAVTWCPICGSAVVYDAAVDGQRLTFGVSGKLADDDLVLYDRQTESEWKQSTGHCIGGELSNRSLTVIPAAMISYESFQESYPDGEVLQPPADDSGVGGREYDSTPYEGYAEGEGFGLGPMRGTGPSRAWDRDDIDPKTVVVGIERPGEAVGFPVPEIEAAGGVIESTVGEQRVVVVATGDGVHAFEHPGFSLTVDAGQLTGDGTVWNAATGSSADGRQLTRIRSISSAEIEPSQREPADTLASRNASARSAPRSRSLVRNAGSRLTFVEQWNRLPIWIRDISVWVNSSDGSFPSSIQLLTR